MPRLTCHHYLTIHHSLRQWWLQLNRVYDELSPQDQWYLHDYFRPSHDDNDLALLAHRQRITKQQPSLPHCAGRAYARFQREITELHRPSSRPGSFEARLIRQSQHPRQLRVIGVVRPEVDVERIAKAVLVSAFDLAREAEAEVNSPTAATSRDAPVDASLPLRASGSPRPWPSLRQPAPPPHVTTDPTRIAGQSPPYSFGSPDDDSVEPDRPDPDPLPKSDR